jgi:hypothetical protein
MIALFGSLLTFLQKGHVPVVFGGSDLAALRILVVVYLHINVSLYCLFIIHFFCFYVKNILCKKIKIIKTGKK